MQIHWDEGFLKIFIKYWNGRVIPAPTPLCPLCPPVSPSVFYSQPLFSSSVVQLAPASILPILSSHHLCGRHKARSTQPGLNSLEPYRLYCTTLIIHTHTQHTLIHAPAYTHRCRHSPTQQMERQRQGWKDVIDMSSGSGWWLGSAHVVGSRYKQSHIGKDKHTHLHIL